MSIFEEKAKDGYFGLIHRIGTVLAGLLEEAVLMVALGLLAYGAWRIWPPSAYVVSGLVLLWIVLPSRRPFIHRDPPPSRRTR